MFYGHNLDDSKELLNGKNQGNGKRYYCMTYDFYNNRDYTIMSSKIKILRQKNQQSGFSCKHTKPSNLILARTQWMPGFVMCL